MSETFSELPTIYTKIDDLGSWDCYHIWHRNPQTVEFATNPITGVDYSKPWHGEKLVPSRRLQKCFAQGYIPSVMCDVPTMVKPIRYRRIKEVIHTACAKIAYQPWPNNGDDDAVIKSTLTHEEIEYLHAYLIGFSGWDRNDFGRWYYVSSRCVIGHGDSECAAQTKRDRHANT